MGKLGGRVLGGGVEGHDRRSRAGVSAARAPSAVGQQVPGRTSASRMTSKNRPARIAGLVVRRVRGHCGNRFSNMAGNMTVGA
jgi:hypothetical protein